jgi:preprotein translocase subunit SecG
MLHTLLLILQLFCAIGIIALVLLQRGKGADAGAGFGSGASGTVFGARGATTALSRATAILAAVFMITSLSLAYLGTHAAASSSNSLLDRLSQPAAPTAAPAPHVVVPAAPPAGSGAAPANGSAAPAAPGAAGTAPAPASGAGAGGAH